MLQPAPPPEDPAKAEPEACARQVLDAIPMVMRVIRREMRGAAQEALTVPQFRVLAFLGRCRGASLSALAEHLGVTSASTSTLVERLVKRGLVGRGNDPLERRRVRLELTGPGAELLEQSRLRARSFIADRQAPWAGAVLGHQARRLDRLARSLAPRAGAEARP